MSSKVFASGSTYKSFASGVPPSKVLSSVCAMDATPSMGLPNDPNSDGFVSNMMPVIGACRNTAEGRTVCK